MAKKLIAVDIDEVLFPFSPAFIEWHNTKHGTALTMGQRTSYHLEDLTGDSEEQIMAKLQAYLKTTHFTAGQPIAGSVEAIRRLREHYRLALITAREHFYRGSTEAFVEAHFPNLFDELHYTHTLAEPNVTVPKYVICQDIGAFALVDDNLTNILPCVEHGILGILFGNYAWNASMEQLPIGAVRCADWQAVEEYFDGRSD